jgi:hypothetical protein
MLHDVNSELSRTRRPWLDWPTRNRHSPLGYVYAVAYSTGAVKVGATRNPRSRANDLRIGAAQYGATITDAWLSRPHGEYQLNEGRLHSACAALGPRWATETFACSLHDVVAAAEQLPMTSTPPAEPQTRSRVQARIAERRADARAMRADGSTVREIAAALEVSVGAAHGYLAD